MQSGTPFKINYPFISEGCTDTNMLFKSFIGFHLSGVAQARRVHLKLIKYLYTE